MKNAFYRWIIWSVLPFLLVFPLFGSEKVSASEESYRSWMPEVGDMLLVDVSVNQGYLVHPDGEFLQFPVVTGVKRSVSYIGRYYYAATPVREWEMKSTDIKGDRVTFGKTGRFLRLYYNKESTPYGIHGYDPEEWMFREGERYRSMGCIIVREEILNIIEETYELNGNSLSVETREGVDLVEDDLSQDALVAWIFHLLLGVNAIF